MVGVRDSAGEWAAESCDVMESGGERNSPSKGACALPISSGALRAPEKLARSPRSG